MRQLRPKSKIYIFLLNFSTVHASRCFGVSEWPCFRDTVPRDVCPLSYIMELDNGTRLVVKVFEKLDSNVSFQKL